MGEFIKLEIKCRPDRVLSKREQSLMNDTIVGNASDAVKLLYGISYNIRKGNDLRNTLPELRQLAVNGVKHCFKHSFKGEDLEITESCLDICREYGFIAIERDVKTRLKRLIVRQKSDLIVIHDWFCFDCDLIISKKSPQFLKCDKCLRVYHRKCCQEFNVTEEYECRYCLRIKDFETNGSQRVDNKRMSHLIKILLQNLRNSMKGMFDKYDTYLKENQYFIYKRMDLCLMREKSNKRLYKGLTEFEDDLFLYIHNLHIIHIYIEHSFNQAHFCFFMLRSVLKREVSKLKMCYDCYERANDMSLQKDNKNWFCLPCDPPHRPVFVCLKDGEYCPAKIITHSEDNGLIKGYLFGKEIKVLQLFIESKVKDIKDLEVLNQIKSNGKPIKPMEMLVKYLSLMPDHKPYDTTIEFINNNILSLKTTINTIQDSTKKVNKMRKTSLKQSIYKKFSNNKPKVSPQTIRHRIHKKIVSKPFIDMTSNPTKQISRFVEEINKKISIIKNKSIILKSLLTERKIMCVNSEDSSQKAVLQNDFIESNEPNNRKQSDNCSETIYSEPNTNSKDKTSIMAQNCNNNVINKTLIGLKTNCIHIDLDEDTNHSEDITNKYSQNIKEMTEKTITLNTSSTTHSGKEVMSESESTSVPLMSNTYKHMSDNSSAIQKDNQKKNIFTDNCVRDMSEDPNICGLKSKIEELMQMCGPVVPKNQILEKVVLIDFYSQKVIKKLESLKVENKELEIKLRDMKTKQWCAVCYQLAKHYCCLRFYCSKECQTIDWKRGHNKQCLCDTNLSKKD